MKSLIKLQLAQDLYAASKRLIKAYEEFERAETQEDLAEKWKKVALAIADQAETLSETEELMTMKE